MIHERMVVPAFGSDRSVQILTTFETKFAQKVASEKNSLFSEHEMDTVDDS